MTLFRSEGKGGFRRAEELSLLVLRAEGYVGNEMSDLNFAEAWSFRWDFSEESGEREVEAVDPKTARCRSLLARACCLLPPAEREEALDEWADEIETAALQGRPIVRRTLSIVFRALPAMALRMRLPSRVPGKGG
ncbi:MAG TPA: hypothetical protein VFJ61_05150 [Solirubrobacterales bacterium]|nr:hypothetical protein [Solirubrobacterales bacterium]